ncbi:MAG: NAD(P)/FAD-dependent oxidoreductase [Hyphomicrobiaceae bacterium]
MAADIETLVVGGGVVGLACAARLARAGREVLLVEQHARTGEETSSRNSEVIHAGLYYAPGSLKARLCVEGKALLYDFAADNGVPVNSCGKLLVASGRNEIPKLEAIAANARASGIHDLVPVSRQEAQQLEPALACVAAYLSPSTGVIDSHSLMTALEGHMQTGGGTLSLSTRVTDIAHAPSVGFALQLDSEGEQTTLTARELVIAGGLWSSDLARRLFDRSSSSAPAYRPPHTRYAKGHYFTLQGRAPFQRLIYPMPVDGGLGVHLTLDMGGGAKFGPDVTWVDRVTYDFDDADGTRRATFEREIRRWWPDLPADRLQPGYTGMRPKLSGPGEPNADFAIHGPEAHSVPRLVVLYGIESPGLTSSLAIAREVAERLGV